MLLGSLEQLLRSQMPRRVLCLTRACPFSSFAAEAGAGTGAGVARRVCFRPYSSIFLLLLAGAALVEEAASALAELIVEVHAADVDELLGTESLYPPQGPTGSTAF